MKALSSCPRWLAALSLIFPSLLPAQQRVPWTTSRIHGTPEPPPPYRVERAYPNLTFNKPVEVATLPGTDRLVLIEELGRMWSFRHGEGASQAEPFVDFREFDPEVNRTYAFTFHPRFAENRFIYTFLVRDLHGKKNVENGTRIVRFRVTESEPPRIDLASGKVMFTWLGGGHNGGNLRFGPDGMLYVASGDGGVAEPPDGLVSGQDLSTVLSGVLRIDVDRPDPGKTYGIPKDNPFVTTPGARGEKWAYGLRNPWRMSFHPRTGELWAGDVGWELWEMVYRIQRGGNYGWSITEGTKQDVRPDRLRGPTPILPPLVAHSHEEAASITGGEFYFGKQLPELNGAYLYGDWQMGTFWSLRAEGDRVTEFRELCRSTLMPAGFGFDPAGELLICDYSSSGLFRFARNPDAGRRTYFPRKLSETGLFADVARQTPAPGVLPYEINAPRWADHATADRWIGLPTTEGITIAGQSLGVLAAGRWVFPKDTVLAKTYSLEMERGQAASRRRIETQVLHHDGNLWGAYTYRWNDAQTDAELVGARGEDVVFNVKDAAAPGGARQQKWRFFSRVECLRCHNPWDNYAPGFSSLQLDRPSARATGNQLDALTRLNVTPPDPKFADPFGPAGSLEVRARSYLHVNCGTCHRFNGGGVVPAFLNIETALKEARLLRAQPTRGDLGLPEARVIAPGDPARSVLLYRMATLGRGHMPYLGGKSVDEPGVLLVRDWIAGMRSSPKDATAATHALRTTETNALTKLKAGDATQLEPLLASASGALSVALALSDGTLAGAARTQAIAKGSALVDPFRRDLFERFLPDAQRRQVLGDDFQPAALLALKGDAARGKIIFTTVCATCHRTGATGTEFGPDLSQVGRKWDRASLLEQVRFPGKVIDPQWHVTTVDLKDGETMSGFLLAQTPDTLTLRVAGGGQAKIAAKDIAKTRTERASIMPEGLLQSLTAAEAAGLLEYLGSLR